MSKHRLRTFRRSLLCGVLIVAGTSVAVTSTAHAQEQPGALTVRDLGFENPPYLEVCETSNWTAELYVVSDPPDGVPFQLPSPNASLADVPEDWPRMKVVLQNREAAPQEGLQTQITAVTAYGDSNSVLVDFFPSEGQELAYGFWYVASVEVEAHDGSAYRYEPPDRLATVRVEPCGTAATEVAASDGPLTVLDYGFNREAVQACSGLPLELRPQIWVRTSPPEGVPSEFGPEHEGLIDPPMDWPLIEVVLHNLDVATQDRVLTEVKEASVYTSTSQINLSDLLTVTGVPDRDPAYGEWSVASIAIQTVSPTGYHGPGWDGPIYRFEPSEPGPTLRLEPCSTETASDVSNSEVVPTAEPTSTPATDASTQATASQGEAGGLAHTGSTSVPLALIALGLMGCGVTAVVATRKPRRST